MSLAQKKTRTPLTFLFIQSGLKDAPDVDGHLSDIGEAQVKNTIETLKARLSPRYVDLSPDTVRVMSAPDAHTQQVAELIATTLQDSEAQAEIPVQIVEGSEGQALQDKVEADKRVDFYSDFAKNTGAKYKTVIVVTSDTAIDETTKALTGCEADCVQSVTERDDGVHARMVSVPDRSQLSVPFHEQNSANKEEVNKEEANKEEANKGRVGPSVLRLLNLA